MRLEPWHFLILIVIALLLFGAPRLPGLARSMGQSLRIFKSEVKQMKDDDKDKASDSGTSPVQGRIVDGRNPHTGTAHTGEPASGATGGTRTMAGEQEPQNGATGHGATDHSAAGHGAAGHGVTDTSTTEGSAAGPARTAGRPPSDTP